MPRLLLDYLLATLLCAAVTLFATLFGEHFNLATIILLFLLGVVLASLKLGQGPSAWSVLLSVACFDFFFVPPKYTFNVDDPQYLLTFAIMLVVAMIVGQLTARLQRQKQKAMRDEQRARALYALARDLAAAHDVPGIEAAVAQFVRESLGGESVLLLPGDDHRLAATSARAAETYTSPLMVSLAYDNVPCTDTDAPHPSAYFPLNASERTRGVWVVLSPTSSDAPLIERKELFQAASSLTAMVLERVLGNAPQAART